MGKILLGAGRLLVQYVIYPLILKGTYAIIDYYKMKRELQKKQEVTTQKVEDYQNAQTKKDAHDSFSNLP